MILEHPWAWRLPIAPLKVPSPFELQGERVIKLTQRKSWVLQDLSSIDPDPESRTVI
jgi:hypothetical protein